MAHKEEDDAFHEEGLYINEEDGMPNIHPNIADLEQESDSQDEVNLDDLDDIPKSVIVTSIHSSVFADEKLKKEMEDLFRTFSDNITFQWLRSFKRLRVNYDSALAAANARIQLHQYQFYNSCINCYFATPVTPVTLNKNLRPPAPVKQFLISPPSSPPVGWEPREEGEPIVNQELLAALASLTPGESHELHAPTPTQPAIVVHTALAPENPINTGRHIPHTRCPNY